MLFTNLFCHEVNMMYIPVYHVSLRQKCKFKSFVA